jgi:HlyD family secretion protein
MEEAFMKSYLLPFVAVVSLLFATEWTLAERPVRKPTQPPAAPPETTSAQAVAAEGLVEPGTENIDLSCAVSGLVTGLYVQAGDRVRAGQKLFSIDDRDLNADLAGKRAALDNARAQLAKLEAEPRPEELPPAEAKVAEAKAQLADAEVQVRLIESVADARAVKKEDVLRRRLAYQAAQARLEQSEKDLALLKAGTWARTWPSPGRRSSRPKRQSIRTK